MSQNYPQGHSIIRRTRFHRVKIGALKASFVELEETTVRRVPSQSKASFISMLLFFGGNPIWLSSFFQLNANTGTYPLVKLVCKHKSVVFISVDFSDLFSNK